MNLQIQLKKRDGKMVVNIRGEVFEDVTDPIILHVAHYEKVDGEFVHHMNASVSVCNVMGRFKNHPILKFIMSQMMKSSNIPFGCPIKKGVYFVKDFMINDDLMPPFIPTGSFMSMSKIVRMVKDQEVPAMRITVFLDIENMNAAHERTFNGFGAMKLFKK